MWTLSAPLPLPFYNNSSPHHPITQLCLLHALSHSLSLSRSLSMCAPCACMSVTYTPHTYTHSALHITYEGFLVLLAFYFVLRFFCGSFAELYLTFALSQLGPLLPYAPSHIYPPLRLVVCAVAVAVVAAVARCAVRFAVHFFCFTFQFLFVAVASVEFSYTWSLNHRIGMFTCSNLFLVLFCCCFSFFLFCCPVKICNLFCFYCCRLSVEAAAAAALPLLLLLLLTAFQCTHTHANRRTHTSTLADAQRTFSFRLELEFIWVFF